MDRLSAMTSKLTYLALPILALLALQCKTENPKQNQPPSRVVAVKAAPAAPVSLPEFCDFLDLDGTQKKLNLPEVIDPLTHTKTGYRWINIWATWCGPCIAEMPTLVTMVDGLKKSGKDLSIEFVAAEEDPEKLKRFYKSRRSFPATGRLANPDALKPLITEIGLDEGAGLPIHIFVDPKGMIRCVRAAAISPTDISAVKQLLK
ncbi:MAG: TlpA family protein disulfide reductase [Deltaproteobacteria bacterium]|nr:TlpA family protein disulfide reductase [Deltaproteobacteria bacterium]